MTTNQNNCANQPKATPDINLIGKAFVEHYYNLFDTNRQGLKNLFQNESMLSFENEGYQGCESIMNKLTNGVKFQKIEHIPKSLDVQPSGAGGLLVMVTGQLKVDQEDNPLLFSEVFHLKPANDEMTQFWVQNSIFRLNYT